MAKKKAILSYAVSRYKWGNLIDCEPSRFIEEVDEQYLDQTSTGFAQENYWKKESSTATKEKIRPPATKGKRLVKMQTATSRGTTLSDDEQKGLEVGMDVSHGRFGTGKVVNLEGAFPNQKATVEFKAVGKKQLLLKFAKLDILK